MSLLADLTLNYEMLADDPIEVGIHYGQSILNMLSGTVTAAEHMVQLPKISSRARTPVAPRRANRPDYRAILNRPDQSQTATRRNFIDYSTRKSQTYTRRTLVGAL